MEIIINKNIPTPKERHIASQVFCLPTTLMVKNTETKIGTSIALAITEQIRLKVLNPTVRGDGALLYRPKFCKKSVIQPEGI